MKIKEITENQDFMAINGQKSAIPGNTGAPLHTKKQITAKKNVEALANNKTTFSQKKNK